eukprot:13813852-Ditylum_brightwellii.AAC.1
MLASEAFLNWTDTDMKKDAQLAMLSVLASDAGIALVNAPRSHPNYRLPPRHFNISINRHLILPLHHHKHTCLCGKTINVCGNHYFSCKHLSKKILHNKCVKCHFLGMHTCAELA